jgi:putative nucleotidyltransferase with HDIG domain
MRVASAMSLDQPDVEATDTIADVPALPKRLLVVDDEDSIRTALSRFLSTKGFEVENASSGQAALRLLGRERFTVMLCDVRMPGMTGLDVLHQALSDDPDLAVVMLTAVNDAVTATEALAGGAFDYLVKPVELNHLEGALERALHKRTLVLEQRRVEHLIRDEVASRTRELEHEQAALRTLTVSVAQTLINAMEAKSIYLRGHSQRVAELAASIADGMSLDADTIEAVRMAGHLHDVGKIGIREEILNKPGKLTPEEFAHVKDHVRIGMEILAPLQHLGVVLDYIHDHHEHVDGGGYPRGLVGGAISLGGRILCAADTFDALTSRRAYRDPMTPRATVEFLAKNVGQLLDPTVYDVLRRVVLRRKTLVFIDDTPGS